MRLDEFRRNLADPSPPPGLSGSLAALRRATNGEWDAAHALGAVGATRPERAFPRTCAVSRATLRRQQAGTAAPRNLPAPDRLTGEREEIVRVLLSEAP